MSEVKGERNSLYLLIVLTKNKYTYKIKKKSFAEILLED